MISRNVVNIPASVKARLLNLARKKQRPFQELLQYYGMERFLFRLGESSHRDRFVLKGALLFHVWDIQNSRATRDIDMLAMADNSPDYLVELVKNVCEMDVLCLDGVVYDSHSITVEIMQAQREYEGIRLRFRAKLENTKIPMQIDFGFGDVVTPEPQSITYPTLLDLPAPKLSGYPVETVISEKLQTMVEKGLLNSRVKDYLDVWTLLRWGQFDGEVLARALVRTFEQRGTKLNLAQLVEVIQQYGDAADRQLLWERYREKNSFGAAPKSLVELCSGIITQFLSLVRPEATDFGELQSIGKVLGQQKLKGKQLRDAVQRLIRSGADVNDESNNGHRPLNIAANNGLRDIMLMLMDSGAEFQKRDRSGLSAFEWVLTRELYDMAYEMCKRGCPYTPRHPNQHLKVPYQNLYKFDQSYFK